MSFYDSASAKSLWRGMDIYQQKKVLFGHDLGKGEYEGQVKGSQGETYDVHIILKKPKTSTCTCPFAHERFVVCKHMVGLYFTAFPEEADHLLEEAKREEQRQEKEYQQHLKEIRSYVNSLKKKELQQQLYEALVELEQRDTYW